MATRSRIGINSKTICPVCLSPLGWLSEWLGRILNTHYNSRDLASELIDGGDMSAAWGDENRAEYYSERGEDCPPRYDDDIFDFLKKENNEEYAYVWTVNNEWKCLDMHSFDDSKSPEVVEIPSGALMA